jgi:hypothetical protein
VSPATAEAEAPAAEAAPEQQQINWTGRAWSQFTDSGPVTVSWDYHGSERLARLALHFAALGLPPLLQERRNHTTAALRAILATALQNDPAFGRALAVLRQLADARKARDVSAQRLAALESRRATLTDAAPDGLGAKLARLDKDAAAEQAKMDDLTAEVGVLEPEAAKARAAAEAAVLMICRDLQRNHQAQARACLEATVQTILRQSGDLLTAAALDLESMQTTLADHAAKAFANQLLAEAAQ